MNLRSRRKAHPEMLNIKLVEGQEYKVDIGVLGVPRKQILLGVGVEVEEEVGGGH